VRNAATLCFAAILTRVLGFANLSTRGEGAKRKSPTAAEFFVAYPRLHPFLISQLTTAVEQLDAGDKDLHPSLCPILTLLSRLTPTSSVSPRTRGFTVTTPDGVAASEAFRLPLTELITLVQRCAASRPMAVRKMAAKALVPLIQLGDAVIEMTFGIARNVAAGLQSRKGFNWDPNGTHGMILQLNALIQSADLQDGDEDEIIEIVARTLLQCVDVCAPGMYCCAPITAELLRVVIALAERATASKTSCALEFISAAADAAWRGVHRFTGSRRYLCIHAACPMLSVAQKLAVELRLAAWPRYRHSLEQENVSFKLSVPPQDYLGDFCEALQSDSCDVRSAGLKWAIRAGVASPLASGSPSLINPNDIIPLCSILGVHVSRETHPKALRRTLQLFASALVRSGGQFEASSGNGHAAADVLFNTIAHHAKHAIVPATKGNALRCIAALLPLQEKRDEASADGSSMGEEASVVLTIVTDCSAPAQIDPLRQAAVEALESSNLLIYASENVSSQKNRVTAWSILIRLMEDESLEVRDAAADVAASALKRLRPSLKFSLDLSTCWVEFVVRGVIPGLCDALGPSPPLLQQLQDWTCVVRHCSATAEAVLESTCIADHNSTQGEGNTKEGNESMNSSNCELDGDILQGRLFDKEADNNHEEPLLLAQLAAEQIVHLFTTTTTGSSSGDQISSCEMDVMLDWGLCAAETLLMLVDKAAWAVIQGQRFSAVLREAFLPIYRLCLAVWVSGKSSLGIASSPENHRLSKRQTVKEVVESLAAKLEETAWRGLGGQPHLQGIIAASLRAWNVSISIKNKTPWNPSSFVLEPKRDSLGFA